MFLFYHINSICKLVKVTKYTYSFCHFFTKCNSYYPIKKCLTREHSPARHLFNHFHMQFLHDIHFIVTIHSLQLFIATAFTHFDSE